MLNINIKLRLRKFYVILCLAIFAISQIGYYCVFQYRQYCVQKETKKNILRHLPQEAFTTFKLSEIKETMEWKEADEFSLHGKMYDVVRKSMLANGDVIIYAVGDIKEDSLFAKYYAFTKAKTEKKQSLGSPLVLLLYPPAEIEETKIQKPPFLKFYNPKIQAILKGYSIQLYSPPRVA